MGGERLIKLTSQQPPPNDKDEKKEANDSSGGEDFVNAARNISNKVVHIAAVRGPENMGDDYRQFSAPIDESAEADRWFLPENENLITGSGVIVGAEGYIVTNAHVINGCNFIQVTMFNKKTYKASIIGKDDATDVALLKVDAADLPTANYGNSDLLQVGQWVLAVGNPMNLNYTATAGIVSAKNRKINLLRDDYAVESFIQTDAVVNKGNSGGALVDISGKLIGINTAIASSTGFFSGYSFAIPVNIVRKVVEDLKRYGVVQRAYLGVNILEVDNDLAQTLGLRDIRGVYVEYVVQGSSAYDVGIKRGDVITEINGHPINTTSDLQEKLAGFRPGDAIAITYISKGKKLYREVLLKNIRQNTKVVRTAREELRMLLGGEFAEVSTVELHKLGLLNGIRLVRLYDGILKGNTSIREGFIIQKINNVDVHNVDEFHNHIKNTRAGDGVMLQGSYPGQKNRTLIAFNMR